MTALLPSIAHRQIISRKTAVELDFKELRDLLATINQTDISELTLKSGEFELTVRKGTTPVQTISAIAPAASMAVAAPISLPVPGSALDATTSTPPAIAPAASPAPPAIEQKFDAIPSPMVGTFYRAIAPGEAPFVEVGDRVSVGQTVCIVEAFKVMNEVEAEISGEVVEILVQNGQSVEFDQPLMKIKPA
jgi:acetyl-CoA carboxylase biotin carboxyl carrier protein